MKEHKINLKKVVCNNFFSKMLGIMFRKKLENSCYVFTFKKPSRVDIHSFFVFHPFDLVLLDENSRIVEIKESFMPWRVFIPKKRAKVFIELPAGYVKKNNLKEGIKVSL
ncbi:hypothetical protein D6745_04475 [Candidatus Woesearchaeota archaeon]|nr:MAG: hypothetical protein D6745_04475 [Candidatus Woesearchaeota archaeon]